MSKLAKKPIILPDGVKVQYAPGLVTVEGKLGKLQQTVITAYVDIVVQDKKVQVNRTADSKFHKAYQGLYWSIIRNFVNGVSQGFSKTLNVQGLGYKWEMKGKQVVINCGYSNPIVYDIPQGLTIVIESNNIMKISGCDKQQVGQAAAKIRALRPPEPYKGKGIRYLEERVKLKEGKSAK